MVNPVRLLHAGDAWERELLESTLQDEVPSASRARVALRLGLAATAGLEAAAAARPPSAKLGPLSKYALLSLVGGLGLVLGVRSWSPSSRDAGVAATPARTVEAPARTGTSALSEPRAETPPPPALEPSPPSAPLRAARAAPPRRPSRPRPALPDLAAAAADPLIAEVKQLDRVRSALQAARGAEALRLLDEYAAEFPGGKLTLEATVLRVRALTDAGHHTAAAGLARRTLAKPGSERYRTDLERVLAAERHD